jgi:uncharacterized protein
MTRDDIIRMAREAGIVVTGEAVWKLCEMVAAAERGACAKLALQGTGEAVQTRTLEILQSERQRIAAAIRRRGEK